MTEHFAPPDGIVDLLRKLDLLRADDNELFATLRADLLDPAAVLRLAAGDRQRLGDLLVGARRLADEQLAAGLAEQARTGEKLGDVLVRLGYLTLAERDLILEFQAQQAGHALPAGKLRLGQILLTTHEVSEEQLEEALKRTGTTGRRVGEELVAAGYLSRDRLAAALGAQQRLVVAASIAALASLSATHSDGAHASSTRASMSVTATVVNTVGFSFVHQAKQLVVTSQDVARGYVEIAGASRLEIANAAPCLFEFRSTGSGFTSVSVTGLGAAVNLGAAGGSVLRKNEGREFARVDLGYRFNLTSDMKAGTYDWPLALTVMPM